MSRDRKLPQQAQPVQGAPSYGPHGSVLQLHAVSAATRQVNKLPPMLERTWLLCSHARLCMLEPLTCSTSAIWLMTDTSTFTSRKQKLVELFVTNLLMKVQHAVVFENSVHNSCVPFTVIWTWSFVLSLGKRDGVCSMALVSIPSEL